MAQKLSKVGPVGALTLTAIAVLVYIIVLNLWFSYFSPYMRLGQFLSIGIPILLSAVIYAQLVAELKARKWMRRVRVAAAAMFAPAIAWALYLFFGFTALGWKM